MTDFETYHLMNPGIYRQFKAYAWEAKRKGFKMYSAKGIFELIRWHSTQLGQGEYKLNNNYHASYARKLMQEEPEFRGFFKIRSRPTLRKFRTNKLQENA